MSATELEEEPLDAREEARARARLRAGRVPVDEPMINLQEAFA